MAIKKAQYMVTKTTGEDIYHFETDNKMVNILDGDGVLVGTLDDLVFAGKTITGGSFKDIKVSGLYKVTNLTGLPAGYDVGKISILSTKAVGKVGTPDLIIYHLYSQSGDIFHNTVISGGESGWTAGGTSLMNSINAIKTSVGTLANLTTSVKTDLVGAVNSLKTVTDTNKASITAISQDIETLNNHNHDSKYILKSGGMVTGSLNVRNNDKFGTVKTTGEEVLFAKLDATNKMTVGDSQVPVNILSSSDVTANGRKVWTDGNDGNGSGLDADKLGGIPNASFARRDEQNTFTGTQTVDGEVILSGSESSKPTRVIWKDGTSLRGSIGFNQNGEFSILGNGMNVVFGANSDMRTDGSIIISSENKWNNLRFKRWNAKQGVGFELDRNSLDLVMHDWESGRNGFTFLSATGEVSFQRQILVSGRRLYIQSGAPVGATAGDIWIQ